MLGLPAAASADTPTADTFDAFSTGLSTATVTGDVNPAGQTTTYQVQYDLASSDWCTSGGTSGSPSATPATDVGFTDGQFHTFPVDLSGLSAGTQYCARFIATNSDGEGDGSQVEWKQGVPAVNTFDASSVDQTDATVEGDVDPIGQATTYGVEYDLSSSTWCMSGGTSGSPAYTATGTEPIPSDAAFHNVSVDVTGLTASTQYCGELVATNGYGTGESTQQTLDPARPATAVQADGEHHGIGHRDH